MCFESPAAVLTETQHVVIGFKRMQKKQVTLTLQKFVLMKVLQNKYK